MKAATVSSDRNGEGTCTGEAVQPGTRYTTMNLHLPHPSYVSLIWCIQFQQNDKINNIQLYPENQIR